MKTLRYLSVLVVALFIAGSAFGQMTEDPTTWSYEVKKKSGNEYELIFHLSLKDKWHIWGLHPGGDGYQIVPTFKFDKNPKVTLKGAIKEKGRPVTGIMDGVDGKVTYFSGKVDYVQTVVVKGKATVTGRHEYQTCSDRICLPAKKKDFKFEIK